MVFSKIEGKIDIDVDAVLTDFEDLKKGLRSNGLNLVLSEKDMDVLIIGKQTAADITYSRGFY